MMEGSLRSKDAWDRADHYKEHFIAITVVGASHETTDLTYENSHQDLREKTPMVLWRGRKSSLEQCILFRYANYQGDFENFHYSTKNT